MLDFRPNRPLVLPKADRPAYALVVTGRGHEFIAGGGDRHVAVDGPGPALNPLAPEPFSRRVARGLDLLRSLDLGVKDVSERASLVVLPSPTARTVTLVFSGNTIDFALPNDLLLRHDTHIVLIRDPRRCFALAGVPGLGSSLAQCLNNVSRIISKLGADSIYVVGISAGASGGLRFACDLGAFGFLGFSVPTTLNIDDDPGAELRHYPQLTRLYRHDRSLGIDLVPYYRQSAPRPSALFVYSEGHVRDCWLAKRMQGVPGVELEPTVGYDGHATYGWLTLQEAVSPLFDRLFLMRHVQESSMNGASWQTANLSHHSAQSSQLTAA